MAVILEKETPQGVLADYWRFTMLRISYDGLIADVRLSQYKDGVARFDGKDPLDSIVFTWQGEDFPFSDDVLKSKSPLAVAYEKLKQLPEFAGAQDA